MTDLGYSDAQVPLIAEFCISSRVVHTHDSLVVVQRAERLPYFHLIINMATYKNTYKPPIPAIDGAAALKVPAEDYDFNFCFPVTKLRSDRIELRPFVVCRVPTYS